MGVTIYDIARTANVGVGTVSRVLNNHPSVSPATREHVLAIARQLDYRPNASAQRLARKKSRTITAIMPFITNYFFVELLRGIQETLFKRDYDLMLYGVNHPTQIEGYLQRSLRVGHADGIMLASVSMPAGYTQKCLKDNFPLILIDRYNEHFDSFSVENTQGATLATEHLIELGHRRIAIMTGNEDATPSIERLRGYRSTMEAHGLGANIRIFHPETRQIDDGFNKECGYTIMQTILDSDPVRMPTAVVVTSDIQAIGALHALKDRRLRCPEDMSIISFDDIELARHYGLTTMHQPIRTMGILAVERLFERLERANLPAVHKQFTPELVIRTTTFAPAVHGIPSLTH